MNVRQDLKKLATDKRTSLFVQVFNEEENKFDNMTPRR